MSKTKNKDTLGDILDIDPGIIMQKPDNRLAYGIGATILTLGICLIDSLFDGTPEKKPRNTKNKKSYKIK